LKKGFILLAFTLVLSQISHAQIGGLTSFNSLNIPGSARIAAMGGSYFAIKDGDIHLAQYNPSLLDSNMHNKLGMSFVDYFSGVSIGYASYARSVKPKLTAGATMQFCNFGKQAELTGLGDEIGSFNAADYALTLGAGYQYDSLWSMGANLKTIYSALANYTSLAVAVDAAVTYSKPSKNFTASLILSNFGAQLKTYTTGVREKLPFEMQIALKKTCSCTISFFARILQYATLESDVHKSKCTGCHRSHYRRSHRKEQMGIR